jgi:hypothetical protein
MLGLLIRRNFEQFNFFQKGRLWLIQLHIRETRDALQAEPPFLGGKYNKSVSRLEVRSTVSS